MKIIDILHHFPHHRKNLMQHWGHKTPGYILMWQQATTSLFFFASSKEQQKDYITIKYRTFEGRIGLSQSISQTAEWISQMSVKQTKNCLSSKFLYDFELVFVSCNCVHFIREVFSVLWHWCSAWLPMSASLFSALCFCTYSTAVVSLYVGGDARKSVDWSSEKLC